MDTKAWKKSINLTLYLFASSIDSSTGPSITHNPLNVATPYRTLPLSSRTLSVKERKKHKLAQNATRPSIKFWQTWVLHWPWFVKTGDSIWKVRAEPVGRSLDKTAVPLKFMIVPSNNIVSNVGEFEQKYKLEK
ncbi:hypothetical protein GOBAR_DD14854 [Gossypium barbadense]|nr:hypothetical protein GOBAR_DD14854 [Gossypium barbadense]